ncbi:hypothetical protein K8Z61_06410 [Nocardioides sp. TRM66260-LWL]|uniref:hypothetical protein n=1 Tax=Nocardioides sp. TRM66260-LWL TaxID=2874478 RepID=UPI001CC73330|nr:hypothetical protein [Nocardioides sp. TRM66260-LWL]MBZ5734124.1 hypothetical protein [Nocardioides sp. TRM66260-LWL]
MAARRVSLPAADDLFRPTAPEPDDAPRVRAVPAREAEQADEAAATEPTPRRGARRAATPSGRVRHDEKMTVYVTSEELLALEHARLTLRGTHGLPVDRGRIVREAVALVLAEFEAEGEDSALVRRLRGE